MISDFAILHMFICYSSITKSEINILIRLREHITNNKYDSFIRLSPDNSLYDT